MDAPTAAPSTDAFVAPRQRSELMLGAVPAALVLVCAAALNCRWAAPTHVVSRVTRLTATTALVAALAIPAALPFDLMLTFQARTHKPGGDELYDRWAPKLRDYYTSLFWTSYVATNLVLPISGYYLASGALSVRARLLDALRSLGLRCVSSPRRRARRLVWLSRREPCRTRTGYSASKLASLRSPTRRLSCRSSRSSASASSSCPSRSAPPCPSVTGAITRSLASEASTSAS